MVQGQSDLRHLTRKYRIRDKVPIIFDFKEASKNLLTEEHNKDNRYIHYIHYYPGRIYPYIPLYILALRDFEDLDGYVLDPFAGSGTILLESIINPAFKRNALGVEINPLARLIAKVKTTPTNFAKIDQLIKELRILYSERVDTSDCIPIFKNINLWFSPKAIRRLAKLKYAIEKLNVSTGYKDFFWVCFSSVIRKVSKADPYIPPPVILKPNKYKNTYRHQKLKDFLKDAENPDVWHLFENSVENNVAKLDHLNGFEELRNKEVSAEIIWDDARSIKYGYLSKCGKINKNYIKKLPSNSIDIIFTSPPYLTAQKYLRTSRLELLWLGNSEKELNDLEKLSIGTERVGANMKTVELGIDSVDSLINRTLSKSRERGLMVYNYFENMVKALNEMHRLLRYNGYAILVVGNNNVLGQPVNTYRLLTDEAISVGFREVVVLKDKIRNRSMMTKRNGTGGLIKDEYVVILKKET